MALETGTAISDLVATNPTPADPKSAGDDHLRLIKTVLKTTFPAFTGPMPIAHDQVASKDYVNQTAFSSSLPAQSLGFLRSNGTVVSFGTTHTGYAQNEVKGADIASAATINLTAATGNLVHVTGTTAITAITIPVGAERAVIFDGALTLTNSAVLLLPTGANITTAAGDRALVRGDSAGAIVTHYQRADGAALAQQTIPAPVYAFLGSATVSSAVALVSFLSLFTANYDKYVIELVDLTSSVSDSLYMRLAVGGAAVISTSYYGPAIENSNPPAASAFILGGATTGARDMTIEVRNANSTSNNVKSVGVRGTNGPAGPVASVSREGQLTSASVLSGFQLLWATAGTNFVSGTVRVYGVKNAA